MEQIAIQRKKRKRCEREGAFTVAKKKIFNLCHKDMDGSAPISRLKRTVVCTDGKRKKCGESEEQPRQCSSKKTIPSGPEHLQVQREKNNCFCVQK